MAKLFINLNDGVLASRFKHTNDTEYFSAMVARHKKKIFSTSFRILECPDLAEEAVQETFLKAFRNIDKFQTNASLSAWLYAIAHNICIDMLRARKKHQNKNASFDPQSSFRHELHSRKSRLHQLPDKEPDPAEQVELAEQTHILFHYLARIPAKQRVVVTLHDIEGLSYESISNMVGISVGTVRSRLHYGRNRLKKLLRPYLNPLI